MDVDNKIIMELERKNQDLQDENRKYKDEIRELSEEVISQKKIIISLQAQLKSTEQEEGKENDDTDKQRLRAENASLRDQIALLQAQLKAVNIKTNKVIKSKHLLVYGYINQFKKLVSIPKPIYDIIEDFYTIIAVWGQLDDGLQIIKVNKVESKYQPSKYVNAFCYESFTKGIIEFKFKMHGRQFFVGVIPTKNIATNKNKQRSFGNKGLKDSIGYSNQGTIKNDRLGQKKKGEKYGKGDIISCILDFEKYEVRWKKNGVLQPTLPIKQNIAYSFGVSLIYNYSVEYIE